MEMKRTRRRPPYNEDGSTAFPARNQPGVYLVYKEGSASPFERSKAVLRYVGFGSKDVYKALYRHFQVWNDRQAEAGERGPRTVHKVRKGITVRVIYTRTAAQARELERALILKYRPTDNPDKLEFYELTEAGEQMAADASAAPFVENIEVPF